MVSSSYNGSSTGEIQGALSEDTFLRIAQGIDNDTIQAKVMILLKILKPQIKQDAGTITYDDIDESRLLMQKFQYFYLTHCFMCRM